jgi:hypothetical protein
LPFDSPDVDGARAYAARRPGAGTLGGVDRALRQRGGSVPDALAAVSSGDSSERARRGTSTARRVSRRAPSARRAQRRTAAIGSRHERSHGHAEPGAYILHLPPVS